MTSEKSALGQAADKVVIFVNGDKVTLDSADVKVGFLIQQGGGIPGEYELQERNGERGPVQQTYTNPDQTISTKNGTHFTTRFIGPINPA